MSFVFCEECWWWLKAKLTSEEQVENERALDRFEKRAKPELVKGAVFQWQPDPHSESSGAASTVATAAGTAAAAALNSALSSLTKITGIVATSSAGSSKPVAVLLRLSLPAQGAPKADGVLTKITNYVMQDDSNCTSLVWTSLELEKNQPKHAGRVALHRIQQVKEKDGTLTLLDHENNILFQAKGDETARWKDLIQETLVALAPQIEDEAVSSRGVTYRAKQLERLETRKKEREEQKKKLGQVTMAHTAKVLVERGDS